MHKLMFILFVTAIFWSLSSYAVVVSGLYEAEVPVIDQSAQHRKKGIATSLRSVLIKLTGDRNVRGRYSVDYLVEQAEQYVQQYEYRSKFVNPENKLFSKKQLYLWVRYNAGALNKALLEYGIPVWGKERPTTVVWLALQENNQRRLITTEDISGFTDVLGKRAAQRGIPLLYPLLDLEDTVQLKASDVWGGFSGPVVEASLRYQADAILTGSIEPVLDNLWEGRWSTIINEQTMTWTSQGELPEIVLDEGIDGLADLLAQRFAQTGRSSYESGTEIIVSDIDDYERYAKTLRYLISLNSVTNVQVKTAEQDSVTFLVTAHGGETAIAQAIALGKILESTLGTDNSYRLLP